MTTDTISTRPARKRRSWKKPDPVAGAPWTVAGTRRKLRWVEDPARAGLVYVGDFSDVIRRPDHTAWYLSDENWTGETAWGVVYRLPGRRGYVAGVATSCDREKGEYGPAALAICEAPEESPEDAARYADQLAEWYAEAERDYQAAWHEGALAGAAETEAGEARAALLALLREMRPFRKAGGIEAPAICARLREDVRDLLAEIQAAREKRDSLRDDRPWRADLREAWDEGYSCA